MKNSIVAEITICPLSMTGLRVGIESKLSDRCVTHLCSWWDRDLEICAVLALAQIYRKSHFSRIQADQTAAAAGTRSGSGSGGSD
jgi:DNA invertase Pin-like site-specific DNA recombinase